MLLLIMGGAAIRCNICTNQLGCGGWLSGRGGSRAVPHKLACANKVVFGLGMILAYTFAASSLEYPCTRSEKNGKVYTSDQGPVPAG